MYVISTAIMINESTLIRHLLGINILTKISALRNGSKLPYLKMYGYSGIFFPGVNASKSADKTSSSKI